jgi:hypothetical protein
LLEKASIKISTDTFTIDEKTTFRYRLDTSKKPNELDLFDRGSVNRGIIVVSDQVLLIHLTDYPDEDRPTSFRLLPGPHGNILMVLIRSE